MKIKLTVRRQLILILTGIIMLFIVLSLFFCTFFLEQYYRWTREKALNICLKETQAILLDPHNAESDDLIDLETSIQLLDLEMKMGINIILTNADYKMLYSLVPAVRRINLRQDEMPAEAWSPETRHRVNVEAIVGDYIERLNESAFVTESGFMLGADSESKREPILNNPTNIPVAFNSRDDSITFINKLSEIVYADGSTGYALLRTSLAAVSLGAQAASRFVLYISIVIFIIGIPIILLVSKRILRPIARMTDVAERMSDLDFSQKLEVKSFDEIGNLSAAINKMSEKLDASINELKKIDHLRKEFVANVSHELKTPISLIGGYAEGLKLHVSEDEKDAYCDIILDEAVKMNTLVNGLLDLSQIEAGFMAMDCEAFDLPALVAEILPRYAIKLASKNIRLKTELSAKAIVFADAFRIEQAFKNILNNAIHHVTPGGLIHISVLAKNNEVKLQVYNDGAFLDESHLDKLWHSFYKADAARTREYGGQGLGLSIVKTIVEAHQGRYGVANAENGVCFWFSLPPN